MCNTHAFYHLCGHTYLRTIISCPAAVDRTVAATLALSPRLIPLPISPPPPPLQQEAPAPSQPLLASNSLPPLTPTTPRTRHIRTLHPCPSAPDSIAIVPFPSAPCSEIENLAHAANVEPQGRATCRFVQACRAQVQVQVQREGAEGRVHAECLVAGPDFVTAEEKGEEGEVLWTRRCISRDGSSGSEAGSSEVDGASSRTRSSVLEGNSIASSRRNGADAKSRIASARLRVLRGMRRLEEERKSVQGA